MSLAAKHQMLTSPDGSIYLRMTFEEANNLLETFDSSASFIQEAHPHLVSQWSEWSIVWMRMAVIPLAHEEFFRVLKPGQNTTDIRWAVQLLRTVADLMRSEPDRETALRKLANVLEEIEIEHSLNLRVSPTRPSAHCPPGFSVDEKRD